MRFGRWPFVAAIAVSLAACSSSAKTATPTNPTASTATTTTIAATTTTSPAEIGEPATACRPDPSYTLGTSTHHITVDGLAREFNVHLPPTPKTAVPLVVNFHGAGSNMQEQEIYSRFDPVADEHGVIVAYPNGVDSAIRQWNFLKAFDIDFAQELVRTLVREACVDPARAYAVGLSSGSAMTATLSCRATDTFAGFGLVAGDYYNEALCGRGRHRPIIIFHGTADAAVPYFGGNVVTRTGVPVRPEEETAAAWAKHNGCTSGPTSTAFGSEVTRLSWNGCVAPVVLYRIEGGGHTWPGAIDVPRLGKVTDQINASAEMWTFFAAN